MQELADWWVIRVDTGVNEMPRSSEQGVIDPNMQAWESFLEEPTFELNFEADKNDHRWDSGRESASHPVAGQKEWLPK